MTMSATIKKFFIFIFFLFLFIYISAINFLTPKMVEDFPRTLHFTSPLDFITKTAAAVSSSYLTIGGRLFSFITQFSLLPAVSLLNIINSIIFCLFIYGIFLTACLRRPNKFYDLSTLIFILCILWFFIRELAEASFWKVATTTYLWPLTGTLFFIYPFLHLLLKKKDIIGSSRFKILLLTIGGLLLGAGHELLSTAICLFLIAVNFTCLRRYKKIPVWCILSTVSYFIGTLLLVIAPGNFQRAGLNPAGYPHSIFEKTFHLTLMILKHLGKFSESFPLFLMLIPVILILLLDKTLTKSVRDLKPFILFLLLSCISAYAVVGVPGMLWWGDRVSFFSDTFFIIAIISVIAQQRQLKYWDITYILISLIALCFLVPSMISNYKDTKYLSTQMEKRIELFSFYKKINNTQAILPSLFGRYNPKYIQIESLGSVNLYTPHLVYKDLPQSNPQHWITKGFATYYNFPQAEIIIRPQVDLWSDLTPKLIPSNSKGSFYIFIMHGKIYYVNPRNSCESQANDNPFFVKFYASRIADLPKNIRTQGYDNSIFKPNESNTVSIIASDGKIKNDICVLTTPLPDYKIKSIEVGQYTSLKGVSWSSLINLTETVN